MKGDGLVGARVSETERPKSLKMRAKMTMRRRKSEERQRCAGQVLLLAGPIVGFTLMF